MAKAKSTYDDPNTPQPPEGGTPTPPSEPPKRYKVLKPFEETKGARWLQGAEINLPPEEAEKQLAEGNVEEIAPPPPAA